MYGLKQAPLVWNATFSEFIKMKGFQPFKTEQCLFKKTESELILGIYVDDGIIVGNDIKEIDQLIKELEREFKIKVSHKINNFVGFEIIRKQNALKLTQKEYTKKLLEHHQMDNAKSTKIPIQQVDQTKTELINNNYPYREIVGSLLYLSTKTRPDIAYGINFCSRYVERPTNERIRDVKHVLKYLNGSRNLGIEYKTNNKTRVLDAYCDADYAGDPETRKSTTG